MGLISPTPRQGSWVEGDAFSGPWTPQLRQGSWVTMDGVLSEFEYHVAGSLVADLGLDGATSTSATSWTAPATGRTVTRNGGTLLGGANGTIRPRFTLATPTPLADLAVYIPAMLSGEATIDEWCLDYITDGGWSVGFLKF